MEKITTAQSSSFLKGDPFVAHAKIGGGMKL